MRIRELIGIRDVVYCLLAALAMTLVFCGIPYLAAGGPLPSVSLAYANQIQKPVVAQKMLPYHPAAPVTPKKMTVAVAVWPKAYHVLPGDSLSKIAKSLYGNPDAWTVIYWANKQEISYADLISAGQNLTIPALPHHLPAPPSVLAPTPPRPAIMVDVYHPTAQAPTKTVEQAAPATLSSGYSVSSSFQACVIRAESGGDAQIWNASGHYGLYQFSASTWAAYGGSPADFGHASAAEQTQVFNNAMATAGGADNWAPYDGC